MRFIGFVLLLLVFSACTTENSTTETATGNVMEIAPAQAELDEIELDAQPQIVQDFFSIDSNLIGTRFCYDYESLIRLILYNEAGEWSKFEITENYLTVYHKSCDVILEFMTFEMGDSKKAFLSQMSANDQQFNCLNWNKLNEKWLNWKNYPRPEMAAYFSNLTTEEVGIVNEYGADFIYINPYHESATFVFSEWAMKMNMGEKQLIDFSKNVSFDFELTNDGDHFSLTATEVAPQKEQPQYYFVGYSDKPVPNEAYREAYKTIVSSFYDLPLNEQYKFLDSGDYMVYFEADTFNFGYMEQFEPRDGFWFYKTGEEPIDLDAAEETTVIIEKARAYYLSIEP